MAILAIISSSLVPVYVSAMDGVRTRNAQNDIISVLRYAQEVAVRESREHRVYFNKKTGVYHLMRLIRLENDEKVFEPADSLIGEKQSIPATLVFANIRARRDRRTREYFISCLPNGASDKAVIRLRDQRSHGVYIEITVEGPLGKITLEESR